MSEWRPEDPSASSYPGPPATTPYPPVGQQGQFGQPGQHDVPAGNPWAAYPPGYGAGYGGPSAPPAHFTEYGYAGVATGERRPGTLTASAVLGYVLGGLLIVAAIVVFFGASTVNGFENAYGDGSHYGTELALMGLVNLLGAGLLIAGGVMMTARSATGRLLYAVGGGLEIVLAVYWIARWVTRNDLLHYLLVWALLFTALSVVGLALAFTRDVNRWLARR